MKKTFLLLMAAGYTLYGAAQTIPLGFRAPEFKKLESNVVEQSGNPKGVTIKTDKENYTALEAQQKTIASDKRKQVDEQYQKDFNALGAMTATTNAQVYNANLDAINFARYEGYKEVTRLNRQAMKFAYLGKTAKPFNLFPVRNSVDAEMFYNGRLSDKSSRFLNNSLLSFSSDGGKASIYNELYADYLGAVRIGFCALISNKQTGSTAANPDEKKEDAVQRLLGGGGNGVFNLSYPLISYEIVDKVNMKLIAAPRFAIDVPKIGTDSEAYAFSYAPGVEGNLYYTGALGVLTFYSNFRFGITGGNNLFYENLTKTDKSAFSLNQLSFGVAITSTFRLSYNYYFGSGFVKENFPSSLSFVIVPN